MLNQQDIIVQKQKKSSKMGAIKNVLLVVLGLSIGLTYASWGDNAFFTLPASSKAAPDYLDDKEFEVFWEVWEELESHYPFEEPVSRDKIFAAAQGLAASYDDDYTVFLPPAELTFLEEEVSGVFSGIGAEIGIRNELLTVISPLKGSPAEQAGLLPEDIIYTIDGVDSYGLTVDDAVRKIRGPQGTDVTLEVLRMGETSEIPVVITRDQIDIPVIATAQHGDLFVIEFMSFTRTAPRLFAEALEEFLASDATYLAIDMRNNPGGYLDVSIDIASHFLPAGTEVLREQHSLDSNDITIHRSKGYNSISAEVPMFVMINGGSASASEILAGALHDQGRALLVGATSFGKGSVQEVVDLQKVDGAAIKVTTAKWLTPAGTQLNDGGLEPALDLSVWFEDNEFNGFSDSINDVLADVLIEAHNASQTQ